MSRSSAKKQSSRGKNLMATAPHQAKRIYPAHADAIRVVPLHVPSTVHEPTAETLAAGPAAAPHLTYRNGPLLSNVEVFTVFWGAKWNTTQQPLATQVNQFFD